MSRPALTPPFAHLNLRRNPFGELTRTEQAQLAVTDIEAFVPQLKQRRFVLQVMGEQGRGKTTHLLALRRHFPDAPYVYLAEDEPPPPVPPAPLLFLDETQRFSRAQRRALFKRNASFVMATHEDHSGEFEAAGLKHHHIYLKGLSQERLAEILARRLEAARRGAGAIPHFEPDTVTELLARFGDDVRAVDAYLYEVFQVLEGVGAIKLAPNA